MNIPIFNLNHFDKFDGLGFYFTLNGNNNLVIRNLRGDEKYVTLTILKNNAIRFVEYLIDGGAGTNKGIGRLGDITKTGSSKLTYVMLTKDKDNPIPDDNSVYYEKLLKPNQFVLYTLGGDIKITGSVDNNDNLKLDLWNIPENGITLPTTVTDGFTNWLSYWFSSEAIARRMSGTRNKTTKFKGHHGLSDIYITTDLITNEKLLVCIFNDKHPSECLIFQYTEGSHINIYQYDLTTEVLVEPIGVDNMYVKRDVIEKTDYPLTSRQLMDIINNNKTELANYNIKCKADADAFNLYYNKWMYEITHRAKYRIGGTFNVY